MDSVTASAMALPAGRHQTVMRPISLPMATEFEPMDLSDKSTGPATSPGCPAPLSAVLDTDHTGGSRAENQLNSPAGSLSSSCASRDGSEATLVVQPINSGALEPADAATTARSQNQVRMLFCLFILHHYTNYLMFFFTHLVYLSVYLYCPGQKYVFGSFSREARELWRLTTS